MIDAEVKSIDFADDWPTNFDEPFMFALTATIGPKNEQGGHDYQIVACNPLWLTQELKSESGVWPRGMLVVDELDYSQVKRTVQSLVDQFCPSSSWELFWLRLNRYMLWEYEDMDDQQGRPIVPLR